MLFGESKERDCIAISDSGVSDTSFYSEAIELSLNLSEDWYNLRSKMMSCEVESFLSEDTSLLNEGSREFFSKIGAFFRRLWESIKSMWNRFIQACGRAFTSDEKFIKRYKKEIMEKNLSGFEYLGFKYTIDEYVPRYQPEFEFIKPPDVTDMSPGSIENYKRSVSDNSHYDTVRGKVLGSNTPIDHDDFDSELFKVFRDGEEKEEKHGLDSSAVASLVRALETNDDIKSCQRLKEDIDKFYSAVISYFENAGSRNGDEFMVSSFTVSDRSFKNSDEKAFSVPMSDSQKVQMVRELANIRADEARRISAIYNAAFGAKLDAMKERRREGRRILSQALSYRKEDTR